MIGGRFTRAASGVRKALRTSALQVVVWLSPKRKMHGFEVVVVGREIEDQAISTRIGEALALIATLDPARFRRLAKDLKVIVCIRAVNALGQYNRRLRACILDLDYVRRTTSPEQIAIVIVHEALHARLHGSGIRFSGSNAARIERACIRAEAAFARRVPGGDQLVEWVESRLVAYAETV